MARYNAHWYGNILFRDNMNAIFLKTARSARNFLHLRENRRLYAERSFHIYAVKEPLHGKGCVSRDAHHRNVKW